MRGLPPDPSFFARLLDDHPDPIFVKNSDSIYVYANPALCEFVDSPLSRIVGHDDHGFLPADRANEHLEHDQKVFASSHALEKEEIFQRDGEPIFVLVKKRALRFEGETFILGTLRDITPYRTEQKVLVESQRVANIGSFENNLVTGRTLWSEQTFLMYGLDPRRHTPTLDFFSEHVVLPEDRPLFDAIVAALHVPPSAGDTQTANSEFRIRRANDGEIRWISTHCEARHGRNGVLKIVGTALDVTERKLSELRRREAEHALAEQQQYLIQASKLSTLGELASGIGHEVATPLSAILIKLEHIALLLSRDPLDREKMQKLCRDTGGLVQKISDIVEGLKELSRSGSNALPGNRESFAPAIPVQQARSLLAARLSDHGISLRIEDRSSPGALIRGNRTYLFQVLVNLLSNACEALQERGPREGLAPWVRILIEETPERIEFRVSDSGAGIPQEIRDRLFLPFASTRTSGKGTGLGLNISQRLMRLQEGDLLLDPEATVTTFLVKVPKNEAV